MLSWDQTPSLLSMRQERAWIEINVAAVQHNVKALKALLRSQTDLMAVVKADAYGHGAVTIAKTALAAGATWLGVATVPEGIELREAGIQAPILMLGATNMPAQIRAMAHWRLQPTIGTPKQALVFAETLQADSGQQPLPVHLKLDTGMSRLGTNWDQAVEFVQFVQRLPQLQIASIYSHLATADDPDPAVMQQQHKRYQSAIAQLQQQLDYTPPRLHIANSAATLADPQLHYDMVRVGLATYGLYPAPHLAPTVQLQPALQVKARVTQVKTIAAGTGVSYGHRYIAQRPMRIAVVGIGYADGVPRNLSNQLQVLIRGQRLPQIGAVTMDQLMVDVSAIADLQEGEVVTLLGQCGPECITPEDWANQLGTISWEILCGFKHRLPRIVVHEAFEPQSPTEPVNKKQV